jgi:type III secretory pathway component EscV
MNLCLVFNYFISGVPYRLFALLLFNVTINSIKYILNVHTKTSFTLTDRSPDIDVDSEDDENEEDQENWSNDELSDSEPMMLEDGHSRQRKVNRSKVRPAMNRVFII